MRFGVRATPAQLNDGHRRCRLYRTRERQHGGGVRGSAQPAVRPRAHAAREGHGPQLVGTVGFKGKPRDGSCEIGYSVLLGFEGFGYATEAARRLIEWAFEHPEIEAVAAETLPDLAGSIRVMEKCGMRFVGEGTPEGDVRTVRYAVSRAEFVNL